MNRSVAIRSNCRPDFSPAEGKVWLSQKMNNLKQRVLRQSFLELKFCLGSNAQYRNYLKSKVYQREVDPCSLEILYKTSAHSSLKIKSGEKYLSNHFKDGYMPTSIEIDFLRACLSTGTERKLYR